MTTKTKSVTRKQAEKVLAAVHKAFPAYVTEFADNTYTTMRPVSNPDNLPQIFENWDGHDFVIIWESGSPEAWTMLFPGGGVDEEFGFKHPAVLLPKGVWVEAVNSCVIALYRED